MRVLTLAILLVIEMLLFYALLFGSYPNYYRLGSNFGNTRRCSYCQMEAALALNYHPGVCSLAIYALAAKVVGR
jgi:hypothetical protein